MSIVYHGSHSLIELSWRYINFVHVEYGVVRSCTVIRDGVVRVTVCVCVVRVRPKYRPQWTYFDLHRQRQPLDCPSTTVNVNWASSGLLSLIAQCFHRAE